MTRKEQLEYCRLCTHREMDMKQGLKCGITHELADFETKCINFNKDDAVNEVVIGEEEFIKPDEVVSELDANSIEKLKFHQDFYYALMGGLLATVVSAILWAVITVATEYQIGYMAIGVGLLVGYAVRFFGAGIDSKFGYLGAVLSLLGCILGNLFSQLGFIADAEGLGYTEAAGYLTVPIIFEILAESFHPMDVLFYGFAVFEGYKFGFRKVTVGLIQQLRSDDYDGAPENQIFRMPLAIGGFVILAIFFFKITRGVSGPKTYYYESGNIMSKGELKNNKEVGEWTYYYENGTVQAEAYYSDKEQASSWEWYAETGAVTRKGEYKNDLKDGVWVDYYDNGIMSDSGGYSSDRAVGFWKSWYENGNVYQTGWYNRNRQDSLWTTYYENGDLMSVGNMLDDNVIGNWTTYYEGGKLATEIKYDTNEVATILNVYLESGDQIVENGTGLYQTFYDNGQLYENGRVKDGERIGIWSDYFEDGDLRSEYQYDRNLIKINNMWKDDGTQMVRNGEGDYVDYFEETGMVAEEGRVKSGLREGVWLTYHANSTQIWQELQYSKGVYDGIQTTYYENGQVFVTGNIENEKRTGEWVWYYEDGSMSSQAVYENGKKNGEQKLYNEFGELAKIEIYSNGDLIKERYN